MKDEDYKGNKARKRGNAPSLDKKGASQRQKKTENGII
jgi:hypothetical protein